MWSRFSFLRQVHSTIHFGIYSNLTFSASMLVMFDKSRLNSLLYRSASSSFSYIPSIRVYNTLLTAFLPYPNTSTLQTLSRTCPSYSFAFIISALYLIVFIMFYYLMYSLSYISNRWPFFTISSFFKFNLSRISSGIESILSNKYDNFFRGVGFFILFFISLVMSLYSSSPKFNLSSEYYSST